MIGLTCVSCGRRYKKSKGLYYCEDCGSIMGTLVVENNFDDMKITRDMFSPTASIYQFEKLLPVNNYSKVAGAIGGTPLLHFENCFGIGHLYVKNDGMNLSASLKDRASIIAVNMAIEEGYNTIFCASTGNAASSLALVSASSPLRTVIFVPSNIPSGKMAQLRAAGAQVNIVDGSYDDAFDQSLKEGFKNGWYCRNSAINPYLLEGKKTAAYEILVQMNYQVPDYCLVSVGDGTVISSLIKGFEEFKDLGLVDGIPCVIGVQAESASTLKKVFKAGKPYTPIREDVYSIADSISVGYPRDVIKACKFLARSKGDLIVVSDQQIKDAVVELATRTGVFAEPAGAAPLAGLKQLLGNGRIQKESTVVLVVTGNGLKDTSAVGGTR
jgi:threonine synthase